MISMREDTVAFVNPRPAEICPENRIMSVTHIDCASLSGRRIMTSTYISKAVTAQRPTKDLQAIEIQAWSQKNIPPEKFMEFFAQKGDLICIFWTTQSAFAVFRPGTMQKELTSNSVALDTAVFNISIYPLFDLLETSKMPYRRPVRGDAWFPLFCDVFLPTLRSFLSGGSYTEEEEKMILWDLYMSLPYHLRPKSVPPPRVCVE